MTQAVEEKAMGYYIFNSSISMEIVSHPLNWKVKRSHADFELLRNYLSAKYPQNIVPSLPKFDYAKRLSND